MISHDTRIRVSHYVTKTTCMFVAAIQQGLKNTATAVTLIKLKVGYHVAEQILDFTRVYVKYAGGKKHYFKTNFRKICPLK